MSLPAWGAWIEIQEISKVNGYTRSLPAWGAWIEIQMYLSKAWFKKVAPRMGSVD